MSAKDIANLVPTMMAVGLVGENVKTLNKKKVKTKDMVKLGMKNIVGVSLIGATSSLVGSLE